MSKQSLPNLLQASDRLVVANRIGVEMILRQGQYQARNTDSYSLDMDQSAAQLKDIQRKWRTHKIRILHDRHDPKCPFLRWDHLRLFPI